MLITASNTVYYKTPVKTNQATPLGDMRKNVIPQLFMFHLKNIRIKNFHIKNIYNSIKSIKSIKSTKIPSESLSSWFVV